MTGENDIIRLLISRIAVHEKTAMEMDYPRIEELCHLILKFVQRRHDQPFKFPES